MFEKVKVPVTFIYMNTDETQYLFSAHPIQDYQILALLPGISAQQLQTQFKTHELANGWFKRSECIIEYLLNIMKNLLAEYEENPPEEFLAPLDGILKDKGIKR